MHGDGANGIAEVAGRGGGVVVHACAHPALPGFADWTAGGEPVAIAWERWARAAVNHHSAATPGRFGDAVEAVAAHLGVGAVRVST